MRNMGTKIDKHGYWYAIHRISLILVYAVILFVAAGTVHWVRGWIWIISTLLLEIVMLVILAQRVPETLNHRGTSHSGVKTFDKLFTLCWMVIQELIAPVIAGLDWRFGWSGMSHTALYIGFGLLALTWPFGTWAMITNAHFEQFVRIQKDREHQVVTTGPYRIVRHPGYASYIIFLAAMPLILGSWWTFLPAGALMLLFTIRTALEDRTLHKELEGYKAYAGKTRYKLLPGIW
ncbi:MAG: isoprenylcysteine carboxylmethyltransferase family protein [Desulfobacterium sp.]|nr:isoprenylcysteine carboxylmethyltransferase family protein [Desulfobacterium sp.]